MTDLDVLYREILSKIHYSATGHINLDQTLNRFFQTLAESSLLLEKKHIDFISYSYAIIDDIFSWSLTPLSSDYPFYFEAFKERSLELLILTIYYDFKDYIKEINDEKVSRGRLIVSELISRIFNRPTPYRVRFADIANSFLIHDHHKDTITFEIPLSRILKSEYSNNSPSDLRSILLNELEGKLESGFEERLDKNNNTFKIRATRTFSNDFFNRYFDSEKLKSTVKLYRKKIKKLGEGNSVNLFDLESSNIDIYLSRWLETVISHGFLSLLLSSWVENIPSVVKVEKQGNYNAIGKSNGTFIVGYGYDPEINNQERAMFRIIADKISAILASQTIFTQLFNLNISSFRIGRKRIFQRLRELETKNSAIGELFHGNENYMPHKHGEVSSIISSNAFFFDHFVVNDNAPFCKYNFFHFSSDQLSFYENDKILRSFISSLEGQTLTLYINIPLLRLLFDVIKNHEINSRDFQIDIENYSFVASYTSPRDFCAQTFRERFQENGIGHGLTGFLKQWYRCILINGNIQIKIGGELIFDLQRDSEMVQNTPKLKINDNLKPPTLKGKDFQLIFIPQDE